MASVPRNFIVISNRDNICSQWSPGLRRWSVAARLAQIVCSNPTGDMEVFSVVFVVCCQVEVSATS
jgi:hypothetical protein